MVIDRYDPAKMFGFCRAREGPHRLFFHASAFHRLSARDTYPPIPGEAVEVIASDRVLPGSSPKATLVRRLVPPVMARGSVRSFDSNTHWGFIETEDSRVVFLHLADIVDGAFPVIGDLVTFIEGSGSGGRSRAFAVQVSHHHLG